MKKMLVLLVVCLLLNGSLVFSADEIKLKDVVLKSVPKWVNLSGFAKDRKPFNIRELAKKTKLSLREALEVQNHYYDMVDDRDNDAEPEAKFQEALKRVQSGKNAYENVWNAEAIKKAKFIIVFDWDDTLINQYYTIREKGPKYYDLELRDDDTIRWGREGTKWYKKQIKFVPYWKETITAIKKLGGSVIFFTAKKDKMAQRIFKDWKFDKNTLLSKVVDGFMTKNHLILVKGVKYNRGKAYPMKDMQLIDKSLKKIILVDDSPSKTYQPLNVRFFQKYNPDIHLADETPKEIKSMYDNLLKEVLAEIEESLEYMKTNQGTTFVEAYKPYSLMGRVTLNSLIESGLVKKKALELIRANEDLVENRF